MARGKKYNVNLCRLIDIRNVFISNFHLCNVALYLLFTDSNVKLYRVFEKTIKASLLYIWFLHNLV